MKKASTRAYAARGHGVSHVPAGPTLPTAPASRDTQPQEKPQENLVDTVWTYQNRVAELESQLNGYRNQVHSLQTEVGKLQDESEHLQELFHNAPAGYVVHDSAGYISELNRSAEIVLGLKPGEGARVSLAQFVSEEALLRWLAHMRRCVSRRQARATQLVLRARDGRLKHVQILTSPLAGAFPSRPVKFHTVLTDVSEQHAAEDALAETQRDYHRLIDLVEGIVWEADAHTLAISFVSRYAERLLGFPLSQWIQPGFWENRIYVEDRERVVSALNRAVMQKKELRLDYRVVTADRRLLWLQDSVSVVERLGKPRLLGLAIDVTERREAQARLRQAHDLLEQRVTERTEQLRQTVAELEAFSYSLSHDMRAPIRAMRGYAELLERMGADKLSPQAPDFLHRIMESAQRLDLLVQDVLQYSRVARAPVELKPIPLDRLVDNIIRDYPSLASPKTQIKVQQPLPPVFGHEAFVGQALSNLLTNAVKFVPHGRAPRVHLWTEPVPNQNGERASQNSPGWIRICVEDDGLGIAPQDQKRIFRIFERIHNPKEYEGTGIGLAIVQKAVERMGGRVGVESTPGHGSRFWIELRQA